MSEAKSSKKASKPKTESAPKAKSESKSADTKTKAKDDAGKHILRVALHRGEVVGRRQGDGQGRWQGGRQVGA